MKKNIYTLLFILTLSLGGYAQTALEVAKLEVGETYIEQGKFKKAASTFKELLDKHPKSPVYSFRYGYCLMNTESGRFNSITYFQNAIENIKNNTSEELSEMMIYFYLAEAYSLNYQFDMAISTYQEIKKKVTKSSQKKEIDEKIKKAKFANAMFFTPRQLAVTKLGVINSPYADHSPVITADESVIIFTSRRKGSTGNEKTLSNTYFEDVYIYDKREGIYAKPKNIGPPINSKLHEATCGLSVDGQEMFLYKSTSEKDGNIYYSQLNGSTWSTPRKLGSNINSKKREVHASLSADGKFLYFSSNRKGGKGGRDIYVSEKRDDKTWGPAKNLGKTINTELDEEGPYIHPDGKRLYFSSKGHPGMGGYDIFYSERQKDGSWGEPINMQFPLNTVDNDVFYVPSADGQRGYYSSQSGGQSNIYIATLYDQDKSKVTLVKGITMDSKVDTVAFAKSECKISGETILLPNNRRMKAKRTYQMGDSVYIARWDLRKDSIFISDSIYRVPRNTTLYVLNANDGSLENAYSPNTISGKYLFILSQRKDYKIYYEAEGHIFDTRNIQLSNSTSYNEITYNAEMDTMIRGKIKKSKNTPFDKKETRLNKYTKLEMELLAHFMKKYPNLLVNISGYDYLIERLSPKMRPQNFKYIANRKKAMISFLISKGISAERIKEDLSSNHIVGDSIEYTIYDQTTIRIAEQEKEARLKIYDDALIAAYKDQNGFNTYEKDADIAKTYEVFDMQFELNKATSPNYKQNIQTLADFLNTNPNAVVEIAGYTDLQGSSAYNKRLSKKRANFIADNLLQKKVRESQIIVKGKSYNKPIAKNKLANGEFNWESLAYNRRVEITLIKEGKDELVVSPINVPQKYKTKNYSKATASTIDTYAISIKTAARKLPLSIFGTLGVKVHKQSDGSYLYYQGSYKTEQEAEQKLNTIKQAYPKAFIFIRDF